MASKNQDSKGSESIKKAQGISKPLGLHKRLFTLAEASTYLGRSIYSIRSLIWGGKLPVVKDGKKQWVDILDMDQFIEQNKMTII